MFEKTARFETNLAGEHLPFRDGEKMEASLKKCPAKSTSGRLFGSQFMEAMQKGRKFYVFKIQMT